VSIRASGERNEVSRAAWLALVAITLAGCGAVSNARDAQDDEKAVPGERTPTAAEIGLPTTGSLALKQAVGAALAVNPSILQARHGAEAAEAQVGIVEGAYYPQLSTGNATDSYRQETTNTTGKNPQTNFAHSFYSFGFNMSWLIYDFGHTPALVHQAANQWLASQKQLKLAEVTTAFAVRSAYFNLVKQFELLKVAEDTVRDDEAHLEQTHGFVVAGTKVPYDESNAQVVLGNAQLTLIKTRDALEIAQAQLANTIGIAEVTSWAPGEVAPLPPFTLTFEEAWEEAHRTHPSILAALAEEQAAKDLVDAQVAALFPSLSASAGYGASGLTFPLTWNWQFGPNVSWIAFNGFTNYYSIDQAAANLRVARANKTSAEQTVWLNMRTAWVSLRDAEERIDVTGRTMAFAAETLRFANERFAVGKATSVDVADAQAGLSQARSDNVSARADYDTAVANCWQALGVVEWLR
jgi:outer membrane protein TolC